MERDRASLSESGFTGFHFAQFAVFTITANLAKTSADERLQIKGEPDES